MTTEATKFSPKNKMVLVEAINDPLAPKDDPKKLKVIRSASPTVCGLIVAAAADCADWVKPGAVAYHQKDCGSSVLLEDGKLFGLIHEELIFGVLPPGSAAVEVLNIHPSEADAESLTRQASDLVVPRGGIRRK